jgi:magnesium-dependent phosphatase-1
MGGRWLLFVDLDGTLWDHKDISALKPPFRRINESTIIDSNRVAVRLKSDMLDLILRAKKRGAIVSTLSWNNPENALDALKAFGILELFDYHAIDVHPRKGEYARRVVEEVKRDLGVELRECQIVYIDDRDIHLDSIRRHLGRIVFLRAWVDFKSAEEAERIIEERICVNDP